MRVLQTGIAEKQRANDIEVGRLVYSPDGTRLATVGHVTDPTPWASQGIVRAQVWDRATGAEMAATRMTVGQARCIAFLGDNHRVAVGNGRTQLRIFDADSKELLHSIALGIDATALALSPDGDSFFIGTAYVGASSHTGFVIQHRIGTWDRVRTWNTKGVRTMVLSPEGDFLIVSSVDGHRLLTVSIRDREPFLNWPKFTSMVRALAISPNGQWLALNTGWGVGLWDVETRKQITILKGHRQLVNAVAFSPDGKLLASGAADGTVRFWDVETRTERAAFEWGSFNIQCVAFSPDGTTCAAGGRGAVTLVIWDVEA